MADGWFDGTVTLADQLLGLGPALAEAKGRTVLDLGCAEGYIAREFLAAGAARVYGMDHHAPYIERANALGLDPHRARFVVSDLNESPDADDMACCHSDIVLALAILHKLRDPERAVSEWSQFAGRLMVVRLAGGSQGVVKHKHGAAQCDLREVMPSCGFALEQTVQGPRNELVQYWRRS